MRTSLRFFLMISFLTSSLILLQSCAIFKASPLDKTLFLSQPEKVLEIRERAPFNGVGYLNPERVDVLHQTYKKISILPIRTDFLEKELEKSIEDEQQRAQRVEELQEIALYFHDRILARIREYPNYPYELLTTPASDSLIVELALVELEPTGPAANILGTIAGFFIPGGGVLGRAGTGAVAFEGQIRDGLNNEILIEFRDREKDKSNAFTFKDFQKFGHIREAIDEWAEQYAELSATSRNHRVSDSLPFTLNPI